MMKKTATFVGALVLLGGLFGVAAPAQASPVLTFIFINLDGDFDAGRSLFTAQARDSLEFPTAGDVTRVIAPSETADYAPGFWSGPDKADFELTMLLTNITSTSATVLPDDGSFTITDTNGDTITGGLEGIWSRQAMGFMVFMGEVTNVMFNDYGVRDASFEGPSGGSFSLDMSLDKVSLSGTSLLMAAPASGFFDQGSFNDSNTAIQVLVTPEPGTLSLFVLASLAILRRRRT